MALYVSRVRSSEVLDRPTAALNIRCEKNGNIIGVGEELVVQRVPTFRCVLFNPFQSALPLITIRRRAARTKR